MSRRGIRVALVLVAVTAILPVVNPVRALASGGYTIPCGGGSHEVLTGTASDVVCANPLRKTDDDGAYEFVYAPLLLCGAAGVFVVTAKGPESTDVPGVGFYTTSGTDLILTFAYAGLGDAPIPNAPLPSLEEYVVNLTIDCNDGSTSGNLTEGLPAA